MKAKILIVDDEPAILKFLATMLITAGYDCHTAENVEVAKEKLATYSFDLLLSDLQMPGETVLDLLRFAKQNYPHTGRIIITGHGSKEIACEIPAVGVYGFLIKPAEKNVVLVTVENSLRLLHLDLHMRAYKEELEKNLASRTQKLDAIMDNITAGIIMVDHDMKVLSINKKMQYWFHSDLIQNSPACYRIFNSPPAERACTGCPLKKTFQTGKTSEAVRHIATIHGEREFRIVASPVFDSSGKIYAVIGVYDDVTERLMLERDLAKAQKFETVGQLAAGIAHEINSPIQYIGDNISFLEDSFSDMAKIIDSSNQLLKELAKQDAGPADLGRKLADEIEDADIPYLFDEIPKTFNQTNEGVERVKKIVRAMKEFSHPGSAEKTAVNINRVLDSTITVCRNEWKYVADIETNLAPDLPFVPCFEGEINQVFLNIIVNGAHAIGDCNKDGSKGKGLISITTAKIENGIRISISDTGGGIPETVQKQVYDPFFTTKALGKGTGQGLAIARRIVENHQGKIWFESIMGNGTTFIIELPTDSEVQQ